MIIVYTGNGKGKTTASVGQAVRALGQGMEVAFAQFMKRPDQAGEQKMLSRMLGDHYFADGRGFFRKEEERPEHREAALSVLAWAGGVLGSVEMLILDESLYALDSGLLSDAELAGIIAEARNKGVHLVLSGRGLPDWLREEADLITEMGEIKHPYADGRAAVRGVEY